MSELHRNAPAGERPNRGPESDRLPSTDDRRLSRAAAAAAGGTLVILGLRRGSLGGAAMVVAGGWVLARSLGRDPPIPDGIGSLADGVRSGRDDGGPTTIERSATVRRPAEELHEYWRDPDQLARLVGPFADVTASEDAEGEETEEDSTAPERLRWAVDAPLGRRLSWETELVEDRPGELVRWESTEGATVPVGATVRFRPAPADRGTEVTLRLRIDPPGGRVGSAGVRLLGVAPEIIASKALHRFQSLAETGEIPTLERNPSARGRGDLV